jgi:biotin carboxyl carrier protein
MEDEQEGGPSIVSGTYTVAVGDSTFRIARKSEHEIEVNGSCAVFDFVQLENGSFSLILDGKTYVVESLSASDPKTSDATEDRDAGRTFEVGVGGAPYIVRVDNAHSLLLRSLIRNLPAESGVCVIKAPMPGLIGRIEVEVGEEIPVGKGLLVLEAMKMENEIRSPKQGRVLRIHVDKGKAVEKGEPLITVTEH